MDEKEQNTGEELLPEPEQDIKDDDEVKNNVWADDDFVQQPAETTPVDGEKVIVSKKVLGDGTGESEDVNALDLFGDKTEEGVLPDIDAKFVKLEDGATKIIDMKEVFDHISQSSTMDRDKAVSIESIFGGGFFNEKNFAQMYSERPTKIGYEKAISYMKKVIATEEEEFVNSSNAYITLAYDNITALAEKMNNEVVPDILSLLRDVQMANAKTVRKVFDVRDTLPMLNENNEEVDISILVMDRPVEYHLPINNDHVGPLNKALNALTHYLNSAELAHFLLNRLDEQPEPYKEPYFLRLNDSIPSLYLNYMSYVAELDVYKIYSYVFSDEFSKAVDSLKYIYTTSASVYKSLSDQTEQFKVDKDSLDFSALNKFVVDNSELIRLTNAKVNYANKVLADLPQFFSIIEDLLTHLKYVFNS